VGAQKFIQAALLRVIVGRVVLVLALAFTHDEKVFFTLLSTENYI
jgi:hypothetical protein